MNVLVDKFPTKVRLNEEIHELNTDFRVGLNIMLLYEDKTLNDYEKTDIMLELLYKKEIPIELREMAVEKAMLFLNAEDNKKSKSDDGKYDIKPKRVYSFTQDAKYIYSAIKKSHGVDLENIEYLHWWKFVYYFLDLDEKSFFSQMVYLRNQKNKGKLTKEEKVVYANLEEVLELENNEQYTKEEQEAIDRFMSRLEKDKNEKTCN